MIVKVKCLKNGYECTYLNVTKIENGTFYDDETESFSIGYRLYFKTGETATFRNGFIITVYANEWECDNDYSRIRITI